MQEARESFSTEILGVFVLLAGAVMLFSLRSNLTPWLVRMVGWTAPWLALAVIVLGMVLMFRHRAGYWSAEAMVGAELLLLALMMLTFLFNHDETPVMRPLDGQEGGLVGWALGSVLLGALGWWPALVLVFAAALFGAYLLVRYTPMLYAAAALARYLPAVPAVWDGLRQSLSQQPEPDAGDALFDIPPSANFIPAAEAPDEFVAVAPANPPVGQKPPVTRNPPRKKKSPAAGSAPARKPTRSVDELPPLDLLDVDSGTYGGADVHFMQQLIETTLADFNVPVRVVHVESGPTVTQFGVEPQYLERAGQKRKIRVSRIVSLSDDLALALAAPAVRIEAPVPGRPYVGIEVPNTDKTIVGMRGVLESAEMRKNGGALGLPLGRDTSGKPVAMDLTAAPHMLIAGQTGAGKSVCINTIISGLLMQHGPESLRLVMVDPKMVELPGYNGIPHLMGKVITDMDQVMGALTWLLIQMDDRYQFFREAGVRNIDCLQYAGPPPQKHGPTSLHRAGRRRTGRPHDDCAGRCRAPDLPSGADGARYRHPPDSRHPTSQHRCGDRPDQGQFPHAHRFCRHQPDRQPGHSGPAGCREVAGARRHAPHAA